MVLLTVALFAIFGQYRSGSGDAIPAVFRDASSLKSGDSVRVAGVRIGTVNSVALQPDNKVIVDFDADRNIVPDIRDQGRRALPEPRRRPLPRTVDGPGPARSSRPARRSRSTEPSRPWTSTCCWVVWKPVVQGLRPRSQSPDQLAHSRSCRGRTPTWNRCSPRRRSSQHPGRQRSDRAAADRQPEHRRLPPSPRDGDKFSGAVDKLNKLITGLSSDRTRSARPSPRWTTGPRR